MKKLTTAEFIAKAQAVHGLGKYDYSETVYAHSKGTVKIICPKHGLFEQSAGSHVGGSGCQYCAIASRSEIATKDTAYFIEKAQAVHGVGKYDYSETVYKSALLRVRIICPQHGAFEQTPSSHTNGNGCTKCRLERASRLLSHTTADFIKRAEAVHGVGKYDYSETVYANNHKKVNIRCFAHGIFEQAPSNHTAGGNCPTCAHDSRAEYAKKRNRVGWAVYASGQVATLYFLRLFDKHEEFYKVGITMHSVDTRYKSAGSLSGYQYEVLGVHKSVDTIAVAGWEQSILETFSHLRYRPKRSFGGESECFSSADEILEIFPL